jgi:hypothetical protein
MYNRRFNFQLIFLFSFFSNSQLPSGYLHNAGLWQPPILFVLANSPSTELWKHRLVDRQNQAVRKNAALWHIPRPIFPCRFPPQARQNPGEQLDETLLFQRTKKARHARVMPCPRDK